MTGEAIIILIIPIIVTTLIVIGIIIKHRRRDSSSGPPPLPGPPPSDCHLPPPDLLKCTEYLSKRLDYLDVNKNIASMCAILQSTPDDAFMSLEGDDGFLKLYDIHSTADLRNLCKKIPPTCDPKDTLNILGTALVRYRKYGRCEVCEAGSVCRDIQGNVNLDASCLTADRKDPKDTHAYVGSCWTCNLDKPTLDRLDDSCKFTNLPVSYFCGDTAAVNCSIKTDADRDLFYGCADEESYLNAFLAEMQRKHYGWSKCAQCSDKSKDTQCLDSDKCVQIQGGPYVCAKCPASASKYDIKPTTNISIQSLCDILHWFKDDSITSDDYAAFGIPAGTKVNDACGKLAPEIKACGDNVTINILQEIFTRFTSRGQKLGPLECEVAAECTDGKACENAFCMDPTCPVMDNKCIKDPGSCNIPPSAYKDGIAPLCAALGSSSVTVQSDALVALDSVGGMDIFDYSNHDKSSEIVSKVCCSENFNGSWIPGPNCSAKAKQFFLSCSPEQQVQYAYSAKPPSDPCVIS